MRVSVADGKYTYVNERGAPARVLRYDEPWRDAYGDMFVYCMAPEIEDLREQVEKQSAALKLARSSIYYAKNWSMGTEAKRHCDEALAAIDALKGE